ncbi:Uncharacterised protein [Bacillus cereus]|nr:hypothetical protein [Bacillus cereus]SDJ39192.1 hypothetical protein SAMN04488578_113133 [Bacillus sp. cl96]SEB05980.1 hypothetical protein SAMN04488575_1134 [Bacillus sp. cl115]SHK13632.1 hypothetical protein SAMN04488576_11586 [Bacillus sp. cl25]MEC0007388.1 hypothetical protein [Bacillus cereus]
MKNLDVGNLFFVASSTSDDIGASSMPRDIAIQTFFSHSGLIWILSDLI